MKLTFAVLAFVAAAIAAPVAQSSYDDYGSYDDVPVSNPPAPAGGYGSYGAYSNVPAPPVENPPPPAGGYGSYGSYDDVPATPPAGGNHGTYGDYGSYKRGEAKKAAEE